MPYSVVVGAGSLGSRADSARFFDHQWTAAGVSVHAEFTGAHLLHLAAAGCILNDTYREAVALDLELRGVRVSAEGDFERNTWRSTGITYAIELDTDASEDEVAELLRRVDEVAEIPKTLRQGAEVQGRG